MADYPARNRQYRLANRPKGPVEDDTFALHEVPVPELGDGQILVRTIYLSIDPAMRGHLIDVPSYSPPVQIDELMRGSGVGEVIASRAPAVAVGTKLLGPLGWQDYSVQEGATVANGILRELPASVKSLAAAVNVIGGTGLTAYVGLLEVGRPQAGETVVVSGAAGATGSIVGQIAKLKGCHVVGIAGSPEKCAWLTNDLGLDGAIDYRNERVGRRLQELCPNGVDVFFDNVGGRILDSVLLAMRPKGRIAICGSVSSGYGEGAKPDPVSNYFLFAPRSLRMEGFLVSNYSDKFPQAIADLTDWLNSGKIQSRQTIYDGLDKAPSALRDIFLGQNVGKMLVQVAPEQL